MPSVPAGGGSQLDADQTSARRWRTFGFTLMAVFSAGAIALGIETLTDRAPPAPDDSARTIAAAADFARDRPAASQMEQLRSARILSASARRRAEAAETAVFEYLNSRVEDFAALPVAPPVVAVAIPASVAAQFVALPPVPAKQAPIDEKRLELNRRLQELTARRDKMLEQMTPAHPAIRDIQDRIDEVRGGLATLPAPELDDVEPQVVATPEPAQPAVPVQSSRRRDANTQPDATPADNIQLTGPQPAEADSTSTIQNDSTSNESAEWRETYQRLLKAAGRDRDEYGAAQAHETSCWVDLQTAIAAIPPPSAPVVPPSVAPKAPVAAPWKGISVLALLSFMAGVIAAAGVRRPEPMFAGVADVESTLQLPVLGKLDHRSDIDRQRGTAA